MRKKKRLQIMCSIVVKRMQQEDLPAVCEIEKDNFSIPWSEKSFLDSMERSDTVFLTAFADGEVAGYLGCYCVAGEGEITLEFEMRPKLMKSDFRVRDNRGRVAVQYGPVVYCAEDIDNGDVHSLCIDAVNPQWEAEVCDTCGCMKLSVNGFRLGEQREGLHSELNPVLEALRIKLIPYHVFANRPCSGMTVYLWYR